MKLDFLFSGAAQWLPTVTVLAFGISVAFIFKRLILNPKGSIALESRWAKQLIFLCILLILIILVLLSMPISEAMKGQLFNLLGIAVTATVALSSTTFVGNAMAGLMLKAIDGIRPGDFLKVGEHSGRVSEQGLLHMEIQTEDRDLTTLPNLFLVTTPVTVVRSSGTIISANVSLGYDIPRSQVEALLCDAGSKAGLEEPFVQVLELGDFSVLYRVAGFLADVKYLISFRSKLRGLMLDILHENEIEIVSPSFMNQRVYSVEKPFIPKKRSLQKDVERSKAPEDLIFDKADAAQSIERIKELIQENRESLDNAEKFLAEDPSDTSRLAEKEKLVRRNLYLLRILHTKEGE